MSRQELDQQFLAEYDALVTDGWEDVTVAMLVPFVQKWGPKYNSSHLHTLPFPSDEPTCASEHVYGVLTLIEMLANQKRKIDGYS